MFTEILVDLKPFRVREYIVSLNTLSRSRQLPMAFKDWLDLVNQISHRSRFGYGELFWWWFSIHAETNDLGVIQEYFSVSSEEQKLETTDSSVPEEVAEVVTFYHGPFVLWIYHSLFLHLKRRASPQLFHFTSTLRYLGLSGKGLDMMSSMGLSHSSHSRRQHTRNGRKNYIVQLKSELKEGKLPHVFCHNKI